MGILSAPNALFFVALAFVLILLLHFSAAVSRLTDQSKVLAQRHALLEERLRRLEAGEEPAAAEVASEEAEQLARFTSR
jgi:F0F1-type ATP synthase membrane subunit b/b'